MTDKLVPMDAAGDSRLELITDYLVGDLPPDAVAEVRRRLEEDAEFRDYCAPIILAWSVPAKHEREPMSRAELAKHWDDFTKRAGFIHQRRKSRRRALWLLTLIAALIGGTALFGRATIAEIIADYRDYEGVAPDTGWVLLKDSSEVRLSPDARLRAKRAPSADGMQLKLTAGTVRVRALPPDATNGAQPQTRIVAVTTPSGRVLAPRGEYIVTVRGDTTELEVLRPARRPYVGFIVLPMPIQLEDQFSPNGLVVHETELARVVRGGRAQKIRTLSP